MRFVGWEQEWSLDTLVWPNHGGTGVGAPDHRHQTPHRRHFQRQGRSSSRLPFSRLDFSLRARSIARCPGSALRHQTGALLRQQEVIGTTGRVGLGQSGSWRLSWVIGASGGCWFVTLKLQGAEVSAHTVESESSLPRSPSRRYGETHAACLHGQRQTPTALTTTQTPMTPIAPPIFVVHIHLVSSPVICTRRPRATALLLDHSRHRNGYLLCGCRGNRVHRAQSETWRSFGRREVNRGCASDNGNCKLLFIYLRVHPAHFSFS